jgi:hypothetical protein
MHGSAAPRAPRRSGPRGQPLPDIELSHGQIVAAARSAEYHFYEKSCMWKVKASLPTTSVLNDWSKLGVPEEYNFNVSAGLDRMIDLFETVGDQ